VLAGCLCYLTAHCVQPASLFDLIRGRLSQADEVTCVAWAPLQQALAIGTSGGDVLCFDTALHSLQVRGGYGINLLPLAVTSCAQ
jgi:hypothetical protein